MKKRTLGLILLLCAALGIGKVAVAEDAPILHVRVGLIDEQAWIQKAFPDQEEQAALLSARTVLDADGGKPVVVDGILEQAVLYRSPQAEVLFNSLSNTFICTDLSVAQKHETIKAELKGKQPIDSEWLMNDQVEEPLEEITAFAVEKAEALGFQISDHWVGCMRLSDRYPDENMTEGYAIYEIVRNGLPVETTPYSSMRSIQERSIQGEYMRVDWTESGIVSFSVKMYTVVGEEATPQIISREEARTTVEEKIDELASNLEKGVAIDQCYVAVPEKAGMTYYSLVPAWRFRFQGEGIADVNAICVDASTGEVIR